ncbi:MAG: DUF2490 domain-containing protein [Bdellovibrionales bacterium]|nr:DUF2490 domain-containing protein [Bdellovibrionales bacterium]
MKPWFVGLLACLFLGVHTVHAEVAQSGSFWPTLVVRTRGTWSLYLETQGQWRFEGTGGDELQIRPGLFYNVDPDTSFAIGYMDDFSHNPSWKIVERLAWEQFEIRWNFSDWSLTNRLRLEERYILASDEWRYRLREQLRVLVPFDADSAWAFSLPLEVFFSLNGSADGKQSSGMDQVRAAVGFRYVYSPEFNTEFDYLAQLNYAPPTTLTRVNHVALVTLNYTLPE